MAHIIVREGLWRGCGRSQMMDIVKTLADTVHNIEELNS